MIEPRVPIKPLEEGSDVTDEEAAAMIIAALTDFRDELRRLFREAHEDFRSCNHEINSFHQ